jgi:hypothetical protein
VRGRSGWRSSGGAKLRVLDRALNSLQIGRSKVVREMRRRKTERIGGEGWARAHWWRRIRPGELVDMADSGEEILQSRRVSGGGAKGEKRRRSGAIYGCRGVRRGLGFGRRSTAGNRVVVGEESLDGGGR